MAKKSLFATNIGSIGNSKNITVTSVLAELYWLVYKLTKEQTHDVYVVFKNVLLAIFQFAPTSLKLFE